MRTVVEQVELYKYDELSDEAKDNAFNEWVEDQYGDNPWADENRESMKAFAKLFPITVRDWEYDTYSHRVSFNFSDYDAYDLDAIENLSGVRLATWLWNNLRSDIYQGKWYSQSWNPKKNTLDVSKGTKQRRSKCQIESSCPFTGYYMDDVLLDPIFAFMKKPVASTTMRDLLEDCFDAWGKACSKQLEYQSSEDKFKEDTIANEWEYTKHGKQVQYA